MKVNNPNTGHGTMIIRYRGKNVKLKRHSEEMRRIYMHRSKEVLPEVNENLLIETTLFDGSDVCFSLHSANLYRGLFVDNKKTWVTTERNCAVFYLVNIDKEQVVFEGSLTFSEEITTDFISRESYEIILLFKNSKDLMDLFDKNHIDYRYHS